MSTLTLLDVVNDVLRRARVIDSVDEVLTSLTDDPLQVDIDMVVDATNDVIREVYQICEFTPFETKEGSITLVLDQREYDLPTDIVTMESEKLVYQDDGSYMLPYPGGYSKMFDDQTIPDNYEGDPNYWAINPVNGKIRVDMKPQAEQVGQEFKFLYAADVHKTLAADTFPFSDSVVRRLIPAITETYNRDSNGDRMFDPVKRLTSIGEAVRALTHNPKKSHYDG